MGLKERKASAEFQETLYPELSGLIHTAAGAEVEIEVNWDSLQEEGKAHLFNDAWNKVYFQPLIKALNQFNEDAFYAQELKKALKKITIQNTTENYSATRFGRYENGTLILDHQPCINLDEIDARCEQIIKTLEQGLE